MAADQEEPSNPDDPEDPPEIPPDAVVSLTPQGHMFYEQLLDTLSAEAGRRLTGEDVSAIFKKVREETGKEELLFADPVVMKSFLRHLRALRDQ